MLQTLTTKTMKLLLRYFIKYTLLVVIFLLQGCTDNYYTIAPTENLGKVNVYIEGDITDSQAQAQLANEIGSNTQAIYVQNTTQLTTINISSSNDIRHIEFYNNQSLVNINISGFKKISELLFKENYTVLYPTQPITINCNDIEEAIYLFVNLYGAASGTNLNFEKLKKVGPYDFTLYARCNQLNFPLLESVNGFLFTVKKDIITFPSLKSINYLYGPVDAEFNQLNFPSLQYCKYFDFPSSSVVGYNSEVNIPQLKYCEYFRLLSISNNSNIINTILHQFVNVLPTSSKNIIIYSAPATGQGIIDKQTIINQGNQVTSN